MLSIRLRSKVGEALVAGNVVKYKVRIKILRKSFRYWFPGTNVVDEIIRKYGRYIEDNDILVISEKALSTALGNIYDEKVLKADVMTEIATFFVMRILWGYLLKFVFRNYETIKLIKGIPLNVLSPHKKLALKYGGIKHFLKPISEAGIDTTNLPYRYVSLPLTNPLQILNNMRLEIFHKLGKNVNILVIDTDKTFKLRLLRGVVFSTRTSSIKGIIDLGAYIYVLGMVFRRHFISYPTPVAYAGFNLGLPVILRITKLCSKYMGSGLGRNILEMVKNIGVDSFDNIKWIDMMKIRHYPVILVKLRFIHQ